MSKIGSILGADAMAVRHTFEHLRRDSETILPYLEETGLFCPLTSLKSLESRKDFLAFFAVPGTKTAPALTNSLFTDTL